MNHIPHQLADDYRERRFRDVQPSDDVLAWREWIATLTTALTAGQAIAARCSDITTETFGLIDLIDDARVGLASAEAEQEDEGC